MFHRSMMILGAFCFVFSGVGLASAQTYTITWLDTLAPSFLPPVASRLFASGINDSGEVTGNYEPGMGATKTHTYLRVSRN